jgi:DNA-binding response OmpR family regulator
MMRTLLLCEDDASVRIVTRVFKDLGVDVEHCLHPLGAGRAIKTERFEAIMVDDGVPGARAILDNAQILPNCEKSVRILLAGTPTKMGNALQSGAQIVLYKPLSQERVRHGLRAVRNLMGRERRRGPKRVRVDLPAQLVYERGQRFGVMVEDLSDSGAAVRCAESLPNSIRFSFECTLPDTQAMLKATAEVVWQSTGGMFGIRFTDVAAPSRKILIEWLRGKGNPKSEHDFTIGA